MKFTVKKSYTQKFFINKLDKPTIYINLLEHWTLCCLMLSQTYVLGLDAFGLLLVFTYQISIIIVLTRSKIFMKN